MTEYGYDIGDMKAFTDESLTVEIPIESVPKDYLEKILGGVAIIRCKDCVDYKDYEDMGFKFRLSDGQCRRYGCAVDKKDFCSHAVRKEK